MCGRFCFQIENDPKQTSYLRTKFCKGFNLRWGESKVSVNLRTTKFRVSGSWGVNYL